MSNLLLSYRQEVVKELCIIYIKSCLIQEYISIFPVFCEVELNKDLFFDYFKMIFNTKPNDKSYNQLLLDVSKLSQTVVDSYLQASIVELFSVLKFDNQISFLESFPNSFEKYKSEEWIEDLHLNDKKYKQNNLYLEYYFRLNEHPDSTFNPVNLSLKYKKVVNSDILKFLLTTLYSQLTDEQFFNVYSDISIGVRLMNNPVIPGNKSILFQNLKNINKTKEEKINAVSGKLTDSDNISYYFPLEICKREYSLFTGYDNSFVPISRTKSSVLQFIDNNFSDISNSKSLSGITKKLWNNEDFKKLFLYHVPVQMFEVFLPKNQLKINTLLDKVFKSNLSYNNLYQQIIKLIEKVLSTEDPTKV